MKINHSDLLGKIFKIYQKASNYMFQPIENLD